MKDPGGEGPSAPVRRFLQSIEEADSPSLNYLHSMQPHIPWNLLPSGQLYRAWGLLSHGLKHGAWGRSEWVMLQGQQRHLLNVGFADTLLGRLRARLEKIGLWDEALVIITSDHGTAFRPGVGRRAVSLDRRNVVEIANVPLFIKWPG